MGIHTYLSICVGDEPPHAERAELARVLFYISYTKADSRVASHYHVLTPVQYEEAPLSEEGRS